MIGQVIRNVYYHTINLHITINSIDFSMHSIFNNILRIWKLLLPNKGK